MGFRESLARANWELNCLCRTGRVPQTMNATPQYPQWNPFAGRQMTCRTCGRQILANTRFCDQCGSKIN